MGKKSKNRNNYTAKLVDRMIANADKGVTGFFVDEDGGCGNPDVFPEFEEALKHYDYLNKNASHCPWDSAILLGDKKLGAGGGCYYRCAIRNAQFLPPEMLREVLIRFRERMLRGDYEASGKKVPRLLTDEELSFIRDAENKAKEELEERRKWHTVCWAKTRKEKLDNAIVLYGSHLHPLPEELLSSFADLQEDYEEAIIQFPSICISPEMFNTGFVDIYRANKEYDRDLNVPPSLRGVTHLDFINWNNYDGLGEPNCAIFPFNASICISIYKDHAMEKELFYFAIADGDHLDEQLWYNRHCFTLVADDRLREFYSRWKEFFDENKDKYTKPDKINTFKRLHEDYIVAKQTNCDICMFAKHCNGLFCLRHPSEETHMPSVPETKQYKVNLHLLESCNYRCQHCFAHFGNKEPLSLGQWRHIVDNCASSYFVKEFNLAGGEPLLYPDLIPLVEYIGYIGADCSIITNGSLMTLDWVHKNAEKFKTIGFSVDSFDTEILRQMGRTTCGGKLVDEEKFASLCHAIEKENPNGCIKMNTVVTAVNKNENLGTVIAKNSLPIKRWKIMRMRVFQEGKYDNTAIQVSDEEYFAFVAKNLAALGIDYTPPKTTTEKKKSHIYTSDTGIEVVVEGELSGSYIMIDANGNLVDNSVEGGYKTVMSCLEGDFRSGLEKLALDSDLYFSRYGKNEGEEKRYATADGIRYAREKSGMTQQELADKLNVTQQAVNKWESGSSVPQLDRIQEIADALNIPQSILTCDGTLSDMVLHVDKDRIISEAIRELEAIQKAGFETKQNCEKAITIAKRELEHERELHIQLRTDEAEAVKSLRLYNKNLSDEDVYAIVRQDELSENYSCDAYLEKAFAEQFVEMMTIHG